MVSALQFRRVELLNSAVVTQKLLWKYLNRWYTCVPAKFQLGKLVAGFGP